MPQPPQNQVQNRVLGELTEMSQAHPGVRLAKKDKILEWSLYNIYEQLEGINRSLNLILTEMRLKPR